MKLKRFEIEGFRRIRKASILFGDATFFIGENNVGKSSVFRALEKYFSGDANCEEQDYYKNEDGDQVDKIILTAEFVNLPSESVNWKGFKGRVLAREENEKKDHIILYRKTYTKGSGVVKEMKVHKKNLKNEYADCESLNDFISKGVHEDLIEANFPGRDRTRKLSTPQRANLETIDELWEYDLTTEEWFQNPGGIEGNITIRLPRFLLIPAEHKIDEITTPRGVLQKTMVEIFKEVRDASDNYKKAQEYLDLLSKELDPGDEEKEFGKMLIEVNEIVKEVFSETKITVATELSDPDKTLNPTFTVGMSSNVETTPDRQGMGSIRSAVFALLRYRENFIENNRDKDDGYVRNLIICFEEPEIYLHPNAANLMRDNIYSLATSSNSQIISSTHSPYMIDISKDLEKDHYPKQILNLFRIEEDDDEFISTHITSFNVTEKYEMLEWGEKDFVKFILKMDDYVSRVFFARKIIVIEGDTEEIVIRETIKRMPLEIRRKVSANYQVVKARGKAAIIALVKYFKALGLQPFVIHDKDTKDGATKFNNPIKEALGGEEHRVMLQNCMEDVLGYEVPTNDKPYNAYKFIKDNWEDDWETITPNLKNLMENEVFKNEFEKVG